MSLASSVIGHAWSQVGVSEEPLGSNSGPQVDGYLRHVGLGPGNPWCAAFVSWCVWHGAFDIGLDESELKFKKTGSAQGLYFKNHDLILDGPDEECIGVIVHPGGKGHAFFVLDHYGGMARTIEGNSNNDGSREGHSVVLGKRDTATIDYWVRIG